MNLNLFENREKTSNLIEKFIEELKNALSNMNNKNGDISKGDFTLEIDRVHKNANDIYDRWCEVTLVIENEYFTYKKYKNEMLLECEIQSLIRDLNSLLNCKLKEKQKIDFMEPDLEFVLWPSDERSDVLVDMKINLFQNHGLSADYYNLCLDEKEITKILKYLNSVISTVNLLSENDNGENKEVEKKDEYCVVSVKYDDYDGDKTYYYSLIEDIDETNIGDKVVVDRMGFGTIGTVVEKEFYNRKNAPYPIDMMKEAIRDDR